MFLTNKFYEVVPEDYGKKIQKSILETIYDKVILKFCNNLFEFSIGKMREKKEEDLL